MRCHTANVVLKDCKFIVSEAGQRRVREEKKKNVHAFVKGHVSTARSGRIIRFWLGVCLLQSLRLRTLATRERTL